MHESNKIKMVTKPTSCKFIESLNHAFTRDVDCKQSFIFLWDSRARDPKME